MEAYFGVDQRRIAHALEVAGHAQALLDYVDADAVVTMAAAYLHDIGIHEAERKHGSNAGHWQELEGPAIAREILARLEADAELIELVVAIVASHHTPGGVDAPEFRILWDADALVNYSEVLPGKPVAEIETLLDRHMVTEPGYRLARQLYLPLD